MALVHFKSPKQRWWRHALVVCWLLLLGGLGVRGLVQQDARYAWGMFNYVLRYRLSYSVERADGTRIAFVPGRELLRHQKRLSPKRRHVTFYGLGAVRDDVDAYARFVMNQRRPEGAVAFVTDIDFDRHLGAPEHETRVWRVQP